MAHAQGLQPPPPTYLDKVSDSTKVGLSWAPSWCMDSVKGSIPGLEVWTCQFVGLNNNKDSIREKLNTV